MRNARFLSVVVAVAGAGAVLATVNPATACADDVDATTLGRPAQLTNGEVIQRWTVAGLQPSADVIPYPVAGRLWEATASDEAFQGSAIPIVSNFNARTPDGHDYRVLFGVATPQGVNPATLTQGQTTSGKLYFDVTGEAPDRVVFNAAGHDLAVWLPAPPAPATSSGTRGTSPATGAQSQPSVAGSSTLPAAPSAAVGAVPAAPAAPATGSAGTPLPVGSEGVPVAEPGGVAGSSPVPATVAPPTPAPAGAAGTPLPVGSEGVPVAGSSPVPATVAPPTPSPAAGAAGSVLTPPTPALAPTSTVTAAPTAP